MKTLRARNISMLRDVIMKTEFKEEYDALMNAVNAMFPDNQAQWYFEVHAWEDGSYSCSIEHSETEYEDTEIEGIMKFRFKIQKKLDSQKEYNGKVIYSPYRTYDINSFDNITELDNYEIATPIWFRHKKTGRTQTGIIYEDIDDWEIIDEFKEINITQFKEVLKKTGIRLSVEE